VTLKLSRYFLKQVDKMVFPSEISFSELKDFYSALEKMFSAVSRERNAWFRRISPSFILARRRVDFALSRLGGPVTELDNFLSSDYSKAEDVESLISLTQETIRLVHDLQKHEKLQSGIKTKIQHFTELKEKTQKDLESLEGREKLKELAENTRKIDQLREEVRDRLRHVRKPLTKFASLTRGPGYALTSEELDKLNQYLDDPFVALATEKSGYPVLKDILEKIKRAMDEMKLKLKSSRSRKAHLSIQAILNSDSLGSLYRESTQALLLEQRLRSSAETKITESKLAQLTHKLAEYDRRKEAFEARLSSWERDREDLVEKIDQQKKALEEDASQILNKSVQLKLF
jgi:chromosome segregation ATPase